MVFQAGQLVTVGKNRYQIAGKLGSGSYGSVYKANDLNEAREKAIKAIEGVDSDIQEVRALKRLAQVESVQKLFETFVFAGHVCLVMECYLADLGSIAEKQHFSQRLTCKVGFKLIDILRRVHYFGVLHRDLKPENLNDFLDGRKAELKLIDFGISAFFMDQKSPDPRSPRKRLQVQSGTLLVVEHVIRSSSHRTRRSGNGLVLAHVTPKAEPIHWRINDRKREFPQVAGISVAWKKQVLVVVDSSSVQAANDKIHSLCRNAPVPEEFRQIQREEPLHQEANVDAPKSDNPSAVLRGNPDFISDGPVADEAPDDLRQQAVLHDHPAPPHSHRVRSCPRTVPCVPHATTPQTKENFKKYTVTRRAFWKTMTNAAPLDTTI
ncbi:hypothetical protein B9Z55_028780 [Caenorhabditis nigoni]|uniref:Protein kinase domain-containing protein n=1 Tax=Caenorhabditis nigoni TaxID=1611254 RepID=A0A2G5S9W9_9PELO|nr:hypothetical protein B9Z55_028780 [Caenorhabditis nigoni]